MSRVLVVEDEMAIAELIALNLRHAGFEVTVVDNGEDAQTQIDKFMPDLVLLDWMLPGQSGLALAKRWRGATRTRDIPIIMLTARAEEADKVAGLDAGADDYLTKPFEFPELLARVKALLRRSAGAPANVLLLGPLKLDLAAQKLSRDGVEIELTTFEYRLLEYLVQHRGAVVAKATLSDYLYPHDEDRDSNVLEVLIGRLRKKLDPDGSLQPIETLRGRGYSFTLQERPA